jgi:hypothetical protein
LRVAKIQHRRTTVETLHDTTYLYNGTGRLVEARYKTSSVNPELYLDYYGGTTGTYTNLDRFGRVKEQLWKRSSATIDRFVYDHDLAGNRIARDLPSVGTDRGQLYQYDGLNRLSVYKQGTIASGAISAPTKQADWALDALGNWGPYVEMTAGATTLDQTRGHNVANVTVL